MNSENSQVLIAPEAEAYIQALELFKVNDIGCPKWRQQHEYIEKLNMQAVLSASLQEDEFIKEFLVTHEKIPMLIHELIAVETWKQNVFPEIIALELEPTVMFPIYMVLYQEATLANLLETTLFHQEVAASAEDAALDLIDYCYRKLTHLVSRVESGDDEEDELDITDLANAADISSLEELQSQNRNLNFDICIKSVSILRYLIDHLQQLSLSATTRILNTHDCPVLLLQLIENPPWTREKNGKLEKYVDNKWVVVPGEDRFKLTKLEGQVWLGLYQLLMDENCQNKYELDPYRKNILLKLRSYLTEIMLDQIPVLAGLRRYLEELSMMEPPPAKKELLLEQVPEIRDKILSEYEGKWKKLAKYQSKHYFNPSKLDLQCQARRWADMYNFDVLESLITDPPKCAMCGEPASKRCSRCQNEWYCRRKCQVNHWKKHKKACNLLVDNLEKLKAQEATAAQQTNGAKIS